MLFRRKGQGRERGSCTPQELGCSLQTTFPHPPQVTGFARNCWQKLLLQGFALPG